ncbi:MAG: ATP-dependent RecD-like DNA helicase [Candidatus Hydrogenedentes bacterium]|nr:ATP-dependent RecD-like DNA helicase [Candidatus Hydrogenedentota bacterium]
MLPNSPETTQGELAPPVRLEGVVKRIVFESAETGFVVGRLEVPGEWELVTFVGNLLAVSEGETIRLTGQWVEDKKFGRQLRVETFETVVPTTVAGIEKYLGSGLIEGIGPTYAKRLVEAFGVETLRVIEQEPERLRKVPGIGKKRAAQIRESWASQRAVQSIMIFLQGHGITPAQAVKIYQAYGDGAMAILRNNPYRLAEDIAGISFKGADKIAAELGIAKDSEARLEAGVAHALQQATLGGHLFLPAGELVEEAVALLDIAREQVAAALDRAALAGRIVRDGEACYPPKLHEAETGAADYLKRLISTPSESIEILNMENALKWVQKKLQIALAPEQQEAIRTGLQSKVMVITGGPGTGKTTVINSLLAILDRKNVSYALAAPTGRAAKRLEEATDREAQTIHRLLEFSPKFGGFTRCETDPLLCDLVVVDEASMIDMQLMFSLVKAIPPFGRLILVGDIDQLPSVGAGNVLMDIIASQTAPVVRLETIFRQSEQSGIVVNAHRINTGEIPIFNTEDFFLIDRPDPARALETIVEIVTERLPKKFNLDPIHDIQVLSPMRRGDTGTVRINEALQAAMNPEGAPIARRDLRQGDKVMQLRNNYELDVYNGDVGVIARADEEAKEVEVAYDGQRRVLYRFDELDDLGLAYAMTVHKSQGSEYPAVVIPMLGQHYMMLQRNVLYTGITRGKRLVVLVGEEKAIAMAVRNSRISRRNTRLAERMRNRR